MAGYTYSRIDNPAVDAFAAAVAAIEGANLQVEHPTTAVANLPALARIAHADGSRYRGHGRLSTG